MPNSEDDSSKLRVERIGTLEVEGVPSDQLHTIDNSSISGVLYTHHPDYALERQVSFSGGVMQPLVQDWLALQDEATVEAYHQAEDDIIFKGERLGIFTDGEMLIEVTKLELGSDEPIMLQSFPVLVHGGRSLTRTQSVSVPLSRYYGRFLGGNYKHACLWTKTDLKTFANVNKCQGKSPCIEKKKH